MNKNIVLTGGGTAGHVTPNLALIEDLQAQQWKIDYIGSAAGVEKTIIGQTDVPFHSVKTGKLRRYFSWQNFLEPFRIIFGLVESYRLLRRLKTNVVFSKGGFVAFPVVVAAWLNRIPVIAHESDLTPGLANRLSFPFVNKICVTFAMAKQHFKRQAKVEVTGTPIRKQLFLGSRERGLSLCGFTETKPCLLVIGGSQGASSINQAVRDALPILTSLFQVIHICGKGKLDEQLKSTAGYCQFDYVNEELADLFAASDLIISRAGANSLYEILALGKPHVLIPLSMKASRGDQIQNAKYFADQGISVVIPEEELNSSRLISAIKDVHNRQDEIKHQIKSLHIESAAQKIVSIIKEQLDVKSTKIN